MTLGAAAAAQLRFIVWCKDCQHQVEPDPGELAEEYGAASTVLDRSQRLVWSKCGSREIDTVVTRTKRRREDFSRGPTPPLINRSAGVVTPIMPNAAIVAR